MKMVHTESSVISFTTTNYTLADYASVRQNLKGDFIYLQLGTVVTVANCTFDYNRGYLGGAIYSESDVELKLDGCTFNNLTASDSGGAIYSLMSKSISITNSKFASNKAGLGSDLYIKSTKTVVNITNNIFLNTNGDNERVYLNDIDFTFGNNKIDGINNYTQLKTGLGVYLLDTANSYFYNNSLSNMNGTQGAALTIDTDTKTSGYNVTIDGLYCFNNLAMRGGCIYANKMQNLTISNTLFFNNSVISKSVIPASTDDIAGGALYYYCDQTIPSTCEIYFSSNVTFLSNNSTKTGGAISWKYQEPIFFNKISGAKTVNFTKNSANVYGDHISSFPYKVIFYDSYKDVMSNISNLDILDPMRNYSLIQKSSIVQNFQSGASYPNFIYLIIDKYIQVIKSDDQNSQIKYKTYKWLANSTTQKENFIFVLEGDTKKKSTNGIYNMTYNKIYGIPGDHYSTNNYLI